MTSTTTPDTPAEVLKDGIALQRVNVYDRDGAFIRQLRHRGTVAQARAAALLQVAHDTDPAFPALLAQLRGQ
ncbi:hypothetical protein [Nonomuraea sp. NPDC003214]